MRGKRASGSKHARIRETIYRIFEHGKSIVNLRKNLVTVSSQSQSLRIMVLKHRLNQCESKVCLQNIVTIQSKFLFGLRVIHSVRGE